MKINKKFKKQALNNKSSQKTINYFVRNNWYYPFLYIPIRLIIKYFQNNL